MNNLQRKNQDEIALSVKNLYKKYRGNTNFAIKDISFEVKRGEFHGFIGANGAGKTTTIKSIIGAYAQIKGTIEIFGHSQTSIEGKKRIGYIPEVAHFPTELNALLYLKYMAHLSGMDKKEALAFARQKIREVDMEKFKYKNPNRFSSGQKKRILLAQALVGDPDLIIMDEPAANLDPKVRADFFKTLKKLQEQGKAIFISSHILAELEQYVDTITIIDHGKLVYTGKIIDAKKKDLIQYVLKFNDEENNQIFIKAMQELSFKVNKNSKDEIVVELKNEQDYHQVMNIIATKKIALLAIRKDTKNLQDIYDEFVVKKQKNKLRANQDD